MQKTFIYGLYDPVSSELRYIGKADDPTDRLKQHIGEAREGVKSHKSNWIRKLLSEDLAPFLRILEEVKVKNWQKKETKWIKKSRKAGYNLTNMTDGGEGTRLMGSDNGRFGFRGKDNPTYGLKRTNEQRVRMSKTQQKMWDDNPERKKALSENNPAYTQLFRDKVSGDKNPAKRPEVRAKISKAVSGSKNGMFGKKLSKESRKKLSLSLLEYNRNIKVHHNKGRKHSEETKEKIRVANLGKKLSPEAIEKLRQINLGKIVSEETREKLRQANLGKKTSAETKAKISKALRGRKLSPEQKVKASEAAKKRWADPVYRAKMVEARNNRKEVLIK